jgi:DNA-directed RNA polymerase specialized sigma24 family protein
VRELIPAIEEALGPRRLAALRRDEDAYQDFWVGVLEALSRVDWDRDVMAYLVTAGYGAVRNGRRAEWTNQRLRRCPSCGRTFGYRMVRCPECGAETESEVRHSEMAAEPPARRGEDADLRMSLEQFVAAKAGNEAYVARRWLLDRADLLYQNYQKQIGYELGLSAPRVAQVVSKMRRELQAFLNR